MERLEENIMKPYHYTECGLPNVYIVGITVASDGTIGIPNIISLHKAIAKAILEKNSRLTGEEIKFLRTEMGMTQTQLSDHLGVDIKTVQRWEKNDNSIGKAEDMVIRLTAKQELQITENTVWNFASKASEEPIDKNTYNINIDNTAA